ncbi:MAG: hypothetical protein ACOC93_04920, partial [Planctomycetota bacterium]
ALYVASGTDNLVYIVRGRKQEKFAELPSTLVTSLLWTGRELVVGTGGEQAGLYRVTREGEVETLWTDEEVGYVWDVAAGPKGSYYAATGRNAGVYGVRDGEGELLYDASELAKNVLALAVDAGGTLYAGTDQEGLVIEIDAEDKTGRIVLDADEKEIAALCVDSRGGVYAATADVARMSGAAKPAEDKGGKAVSVPQQAAETKAETAPAKSEESEQTPEKNRSAGNAAAKGGETVPAPGGGRVQTRSSANTGGGGNAVYYIAPDGIVSEVLRRPVATLSLALSGEHLLVGTGDEGKLFRLRADGDATTVLADTEAAQVTALASQADGTVYFGTANKGSVGRIGTKLVDKAVYTSPALDAKQIARWGTVRLSTFTPKGTRVAVATRSGNVSEPSEKTWSDWTTVKGDGDHLQIPSPAGRFLQYRLTLKRPKKAPAPAPVVRQVQAIYQLGNLRPVIQKIAVQPHSNPKGRGTNNENDSLAYRIVKIEASDANQDDLVYSIAFRQTGTETWVEIAEPTDEPQIAWDSRTVPDGEYELRAVASDQAANPPGSALSAGRVSAPLIVDNTAPEVRKLRAKVGADGSVTLTGEATDATSRIAGLAYAVDSNDEWTPILPADRITDSSRESFEVRLPELEPGAHRIAVRAVDPFRNTGYASTHVNIDP